MHQRGLANDPVEATGRCCHFTWLFARHFDKSRQTLVWAENKAPLPGLLAARVQLPVRL